MSAKDEMRAMLAQLMGSTEGKKDAVTILATYPGSLITSSVFLPDTNAPKIRFSDSRVCRPFLLACCPHDILDSTVGYTQGI